MMVKSKKNYKFEQINILKSILVIGIIILHYINYGGFFENEVSFDNKILINFLESASIVCCNIFVIITGFLYVKKDKIKLRKIFDIIIMLITYGIIIFAVALIFKIQSLSFDTLLLFQKSITSRWFVTIYIILYLLVPYLNRLIKVLNRREFLILICILLFFFSVWPTFYDNITLKDNGYGIINFIILYFIGAYIKLYIKDYNNKCLICLYLITLLLTFFGSFYVGRVWMYSSIICIINSICLFLLFINTNLKTSFLFNCISKCSLAIYIIHENQLIVRYLFQNIFKTKLFYVNNYLFLHIIACVLIILFLCCIIEMIRIKIMDSYVNKIIDKIKFINKQV